jgi:hypothetical protein
VYVDPRLREDFPPGATAQLLRAIGKAPAPVFVLAVPVGLATPWANGQQLATAVHSYLRRAGIYLTTDADGSSVDAFTWPSDPRGTDAPPYHAHAAAALANDNDDPTEPYSAKFTTCVQYITDHEGLLSAANIPEGALLSGLGFSPGVLDGAPAQPSSSDRNTIGWLLAVGIPAVIGLLAWLGVATASRRRSPYLTPLPVFAATRDADEHKLRELATEQVSELRKLVDWPSGPAADATGGNDDVTGVRLEQARAEITQALRAHEAAEMVLGSASGRADLAGVLTLTHLGRNAVERTHALWEDRRPWATCPLCFFNPLHGEGTRQVHWRLRGSTQSHLLRTCPQCAAGINDVDEGSPPAGTLTGQSLGGDYPYYEADPESSVWAAAGYGQFDDLIRAVLTRGVRPGT